MANTIILKRSATPGKTPTTGQLSLGEIAINTYDGKLFIKKDDGTAAVVQIGGVNSVNGETGAVTLTTDDISDTSQTNKWASASVVRGHLSAGTGISYNSGTGVISTAQNLSTAGSPTFAGLTLTGNMGITGNIVPSADNTYDLGSASYMWRDIYVGPGSLYVNGQKVLEDNSGTITVSADANQSLQLITSGTGNVQLSTGVSGVIQVSSTLQIASGYNITDSAGVEVNFGDNIDMNNNKIVGMGAPSASTDAATKGYVDTAISGISTSSISQGNSNVTVTDSGTGTVTVTVDGSTALTVGATGVVVAGNFTVQGTTTTVESNTVSVADNIITLNSDVTGAPSQNAGIEVERGDEANVSIRWNEGTDVWQFTNDGATFYPIAVNTDGLTEGSTNLYHTTARARGAISATSATGVSYNSTTGTISLGSIPNSSLTNNSITINGTATALGGTRTLGTDDVAEGSTNLYYTDARARAALSASTGISYNSTTGAISTSAIPNASLANSAVTVGSTSISLGATSTTLAGLTSVTSTGFTGALTGNADTATSAGKWTTARTITLGGDLSGSVSIDGSANVTLTATVASNTVALGTDTTGDYVASMTAGTGITVGTATGEGSTPVITNTDTGSAQNIYKNITDGTTTAAAGSNNDTIKFRAGTGVTVAVGSNDATHGDNVLITNSGVTSAVAGTGVSVSGATGAVTFSIGQAVATSSNVQFNSLGVGTAGSGTAGQIRATNEITAYYSDKRLKENIKPIENALAKTLALHGVTYNANDVAASFGYTNKEAQVGLLAQDVKAVLPEVVVPAPFDIAVRDGKEVSKSGEDYMTVKYEKIVALLVEAIKELNDKVESLEAKLSGPKSL